MGGFGAGFTDGLRGALTVLRTPRLWPSVLVPFVLALGVLVLLFLGAVAARDRLMDALPASWGGLRGAVLAASYVAMPVVGLFLFLPLASLIAAPFNEAIAEHVETAITGRVSPPFALGRFLVDLGRALAHELRKLVRWAVLSALVLLLSLLVPGIGPIIGLAGGGYVVARFAAYDALDATLSRWGWSYDRKTAFLRRHRARCLGLGGFVALLLVVPGVNALALPLGVAGGAILAVALAPPEERGG